MAELRASDLDATYQATNRGLTRRAYRVAAAAFVWLALLGNIAVMVALWLSGGGVADVHDPGTLFTSIGRITGLVSAYLALVQVVLLARLPLLERLIGFDSLTVWHRRNGKLCLYLVLAHVVFITVGYALMDKLSLVAESRRLLTNYPGMVTATFGTALFVVVVISSFIIVRRRLRYEAWYVVHLTIYAGIALAWFHQIPTGNEFITNQGAAAYWRSLYAVTALILVLFRFVIPAIGAAVYDLKVQDVRVETPDVVSLRIVGHSLHRLDPRAGQFFLWRFVTWDRWWEAHPFSLSQAPDGQVMRITVKRSGDFTGRMANIPPGTRVIAEGPFGVFTDESRTLDRVLMIAGGIGITPIRALAESMQADVVVIYRALREEDIVFRTEFEKLCRDRDVVVHFVVGDHSGPTGERLMSPAHLQELVPDISSREVYVCGPPGMANAIEVNVRKSGVPGARVHVERFAL